MNIVSIEKMECQKIIHDLLEKHLNALIVYQKVSKFYDKSYHLRLTIHFGFSDR